MANTPTSAPPANAPLEPGTILQNRYVIERLLGGGGMGMVYLARDQRLANRNCAVKEMVDHFIDQQQRIEANEYFAREADTLAQLKHPSIPGINDRFDDLNRHYLVMEYVEGRNLEEEMAARAGPLPEGLVVDIARQLCDVLAYLHGSVPPIIYRDMKPSNVMLTPKGKAMLVDFGIARLFKSARKGTMIGTLGFAPPEQYQGMVDPRSDLYSLGATLHYCLTNRDPEKFPPFSFPPVRELRPQTSTNLAAAIDAALSYQVEARPASVQDFRDMMLYGRGIGDASRPAVSSNSGTAGIAPPEPDFDEPPIVLHRRVRSRLRRAIVMLVVLGVVGGGAFGATYVYSNPALQEQLGIKSFIDSLPWNVQDRLEAAASRPLKFERVTLALSTRDGTPMSEPRAAFTNVELAKTRYLQWNATFDNRLAGLKGQDETVEARFYNSAGLQIASSDANRFVGPSETTVEFGAVALMPDLSMLAPGSYKVGLYANDHLAAEQAFTVAPDLNAIKQEDAAAAAAAAEANAEAQRQRQAAEKLAMLEQRRQKPLTLAAIRLVNSTKSGTPLSGAETAFNASKLLFVNWELTFENRLYSLDSSQYRVDAAYIAPDGHTLGSVDDIRTVPASARTATFSGRVGNSAGGAFLPGPYTVNFYLNGQYVAQKKFQVLADTSAAPYPASLGPSSGSGSMPPPPLDTPTLASGKISGLSGQDNIPLELRLRPQSNGFLHGDMVIHESGYGATPIEGFIRGDHVAFQVSYGATTIDFEGQRSGDQIAGTFNASPTGDHGSWSTQTN
ncbi:MAG TPA: serine/threonine-protein kinase [Candidatus Binataceae bacterium]|nr:serine/threonine-protein kinase [Candidatus Binataceae bacterium]